MTLSLTTEFERVLQLLLDEIDDIEATGAQRSDESATALAKPTAKFFAWTRRFAEEIQLVKESQRRNEVARPLHFRLNETCSIEDLHKGETYQNLDFLFSRCPPLFHVTSYASSEPVQCLFDSAGKRVYPWRGQTDGEAIERAWALSNTLSCTTTQMAAGGRQDTIVDTYIDWNWLKRGAMANKRAVAKL
ncbi:hypothetical protein C8R43DRAFT_1122452 [Mycena crocata]|nr:hypothetical protein C8R43DRAFT_1122452 [Mycena crocata]